MKVFLDVGAHTGETLEAILDLPFDRIYCFEPVSACRGHLEKFSDPRLTILPFGLSNSTGWKRVYNAGTLGASVYSGSTFSQSCPEDIAPMGQAEECSFVRASDWFRDNLGTDDFILAKLNCEGSECDILDDLMDSGEISKLHTVNVSFDVAFFPDLKHREQQTTLRLQALGKPALYESNTTMKGRTHRDRAHHWIEMAMVEAGLIERTKLCFLIITDGRKECFEQTFASWQEKADFSGCLVDLLVVNDSADRLYARWLQDNYIHMARFVHHKERQGFGGAIQSAWANLLPDTEFILHLEDDFLLNEPLKIHDMISVLKANPLAAQVALYRQAWGAEVAHGGYMKQFAGRFKDTVYCGSDGLQHKVVEHRHCFTTNPSVYPVKITQVGWPDGKDSEGHFGFKLWGLGYVCLIWGTTDDPPRVHHIGKVRVGKGY